MTKIDNRIPVTILTGFLGAGKTTVLNHLIQNYPNKKIAIIENEFGEIGIDNDLIIRPENGIVELSNGCICCTLNEELVEALERLLNSEHTFNHLLLETTGIAEPDAIALAFLATPDIQAHFRIDAVVCVADAHHLEEILIEREEARQQLTFADFVVLNKASEVSAERLEELKGILRSANPFATIETADQGKVQTNILDLKAYSAQELEKKLERETSHHDHDHVCDAHCDHKHEHSSATLTNHKHEHKHDHTCDEHCEHEHSSANVVSEPAELLTNHTHEHKHKHRHHSHDIVSESFVFSEPLDMLKFRHWINVVLFIQKQSIYRIKGILNFAWEEEKLVFQSVQQMFVFQRGSAWGNDELKQTRIVFIGKKLNRGVLEKSLQQCYYKADEYEEVE